ncbi:hypothetical protein I3J27_37955 [Bradyrhizobium xenonodulans]|uniref:Uncharacterized protein n=1 Tax=Bradyrhizobium xenonodulans TaxID=2736875 RepID=A0ABY7MP04_9BRAD|nr:hypothetical protein [Bradyrhizobium xenonodulans]WBL78655.1 hypothetical protein I3J27_37955 [Bradyrhizobium xenonodulans]
MAKIGKPSEPHNVADNKKVEGGAKKPPPPLDDDEYEDGDIATPKRDRYGADDEPL